MPQLHTFEIKMQEIQRNGTLRLIRQTARVETIEQVIELYGLEEPDIASYSIEKLD